MKKTPDYSAMTDEDFHRTLCEVLDEELRTSEAWLDIPGIYEIVSEEFNNDTLDLWAENNPELAYGTEEEEDHF